MSDNSITRVHYFEGQFLRTQDFTDEQAYHVAMRRRHNIAHHTWGIVSGLQVVLEEENFYVQPGVAVDGYGRELILAERQTLSSTAFTDKASTELDVWLVYSLQSSDQTPAGYSGCGNGKQKKSASSFYRWQETAKVLLEKTDTDFPDRRQPKGLLVRDRNFAASQTPPDSPASYWPVFLGQIISDPADKDKPLAVKMENRPYVGLVGEAVEAPSGRTRVQIGSELSEDTKRFVISTRNETSAPNIPGSTAAGLDPRIEIDKSGEISVHGDTSLYGYLSLEGGAVEFQAGDDRHATRAWNIYHLGPTPDRLEDQLIIEMAGPPLGAAPGGNEVVIGAWKKGPDETGEDKESFKACLTIRDDGAVTIAGNLTVNGRVTAQSYGPTKVSAAANSAATSALVSGILGTSGRLPGIPGGGAGGMTTSMVSGGIDSVETFVERIASDATVRAAVVEQLKRDHANIATELSTALRP